VISRLQVLAEKVNARTHPLTGKARMSINMIQAGEKINVLPDKCIITIDRRITPAENFKDAHNEIQMVLDELKAGDPELDIELITKPGMHPVASDPDSELVKVLKSAGEDIRGGIPIIVTGSQGSSDYSWYVNILGKPAASYSMSSTERRGHAPNEYVLVDDLVKTAKAYALTYMRYLGAEPL
jgi:acetylornithine deacetylase